MGQVSAPGISIWQVPDIVSGSRHLVPVTLNLCRSQFATEILRECNSNLDKNSQHNVLYKDNDSVDFMDHHLHIRHFLYLNEFFCYFANRKHTKCDNAKDKSNNMR